jgi:hypothetical protein
LAGSSTPETYGVIVTVDPLELKVQAAVKSMLAKNLTCKGRIEDFHPAASSDEPPGYIPFTA